ncbi:hypothetical protein, partial [Streptomyces sp. NPDC001315]|uniref:hypothetical protein n=1 Tax=Streptomyces sp. NPDC001315 TaxID=3364562 RepID=UPI00369905F7
SLTTPTAKNPETITKSPGQRFTHPVLDNGFVTVRLKGCQGRGVEVLGSQASNKAPHHSTSQEERFL